MPNEITSQERDEQERLEVEAMIREKHGIQEELVNKAKSKNIKVLYLNHDKFNIENRFLAIINVEDKEAGIVCEPEFMSFDWFDIFMLHKNRLKLLNTILDSDNIVDNEFVWGYLDNDNKLHTKDGEKQMNFETAYNRGLTYLCYKSDDEYKYIVQERENQFQICQDCGKKMINESDMVKTEDGAYHCSSCASSYNIGVCEHCGKIHKRTKIVIDAESIVKDKNIGDTINLCYNCIDTLYNRCEHCGRYITKPKRSCNDCKFSVILNYSTKPAPVFKKLKNETTKSYFGWEWEVETKHNPKDIAKIANQTGDGLLYCKHDGSIRNGCEIVTHPMTYNFFKKNEKMFKEMFKKIKDVGGHSLDMENTGVHVHISRDAFDNQDHIINFARCISQPSEYSEFIALRKGNNYAHYRKSSTSEIKKEYLRHSDRYRAVNFCNRNTIEVRIYKGTISYDAILMYLQHITCCIEYSRQMKVTSRLNVDKLLDFVLSKRNKEFSMLRTRTKVFKYLRTKCAINE